MKSKEDHVHNYFKYFQVDPSGPLATLRNLLLGEESIASLKMFLENYWYAVIFIAIAVIILMVSVAIAMK